MIPFIPVDRITSFPSPSLSTFTCIFILRRDSISFWVVNCCKRITCLKVTCMARLLFQYINTHTHTQFHTRTCTCIYSHLNIYLHTYVVTYERTAVWTYGQTHTHTRMHAYLHAFTHTLKYKNGSTYLHLFTPMA